ncbi:19615_t:CDS:1, partial [Racocetra fulgida]
LTQPGGQDAVTPLESTEGQWVSGITNNIPRGSDNLIPIEVVQCK